uniref:Dishevelled binding antagonist of beta catenin 1 n=1 Tax=Leptobrachium leishanense TaxID=445787 RepID=A0A8C5WJM7_9ANUR
MSLLSVGRCWEGGGLSGAGLGVTSRAAGDAAGGRAVSSRRQRRRKESGPAEPGEEPDSHPAQRVMKPEPPGCPPRRTEADWEHQRTRERLEATLAGLGELGYLRRRQELLVRAILGPAEPTPRAESSRSLEEKLLEDNISILKRQLNCLRKRDAGLLSQLHELDKQISDLKLDTEKSEPRETDSRPSSGFYELSDGTSGSLSNSSNSVFSECLSSCQSSTCFCSPLDAPLNLTDGHPKPADDLLEWLEFRDGQSEMTGTMQRSFCIIHSNTVETVTDVNPKYQCDLVSKNGSDIYRYPSPLHAVAVQSPMFVLSMMGSITEEQEATSSVAGGCVDPELDSSKPEEPFLQQNSGCSVSVPPTRKLDGYILSIIQKKSHPVRTNKPRTSVNADPVKCILRHGSMCIKQPGAASHCAISNPKNSKQSCLHSSAITSLENGTCPSLKQGLNESLNEQLESKRLPSTPGYSQSNLDELQGQNTSRLNGMLTGQGLEKNPPAGTSSALMESSSVLNTPSVVFNSTSNASLKEGLPLPIEIKVLPPTKRLSPKNTVSSCHSSFHERPSLDFKSEGSSSQSLDEGLLVNAHYIPAQQQAIKLHKATKNVKIVKSSTLKSRVHVQHVMENCSHTLKEKGKVLGKKCRFPEDLDTNKKIKRSSPRGKKLLHLSGESAGGKNPGTARPGSKIHGHTKDVVVAKPKHKRGDYRRWKSTAEISYEEALRRARRRHQGEVVGVYTQVPLPYASPYAYTASDSEYSAECESLFHSTVVDTSEDEQSNYTTNCFGDSESSLSEVEFVGESTTSTSDTDESGGLVWSQFVQTLPVQSATTAELHTAAKAFVKIKASHNLKKKILRFRSGSLKLMTTV